MLKKNTGITIISLVIVIVLLLILSTVTINTGTTLIAEGEDSKLKSELDIVQHAVLEQYTKFKAVKDEDILIGNKVNDEELEKITDELGIYLVNIPNTYKNTDYYKLNKDQLLQLGIKNSSDEYIVNYVSGEVINCTQKTTSKKEPLYVKAYDFEE